mmetsp:Transcript_25558/g.51303  ORF Transcript_25558/g.51303 Transcript_25558/m.51303 type:complete len:215 (+) Transcript_25558:477-1121(+)
MVIHSRHPHRLPSTHRRPHGCALPAAGGPEHNRPLPSHGHLPELLIKRACHSHLPTLKHPPPAPPPRPPSTSQTLPAISMDWRLWGDMLLVLRPKSPDLLDTRLLGGLDALPLPLVCVSDVGPSPGSRSPDAREEDRRATRPRAAFDEPSNDAARFTRLTAVNQAPPRKMTPNIAVHMTNWKQRRMEASLSSLSTSDWMCCSLVVLEVMLCNTL